MGVFSICDGECPLKEGRKDKAASHGRFPRRYGSLQSGLRRTQEILGDLIPRDRVPTSPKPYLFTRNYQSLP